MLNTYLTAAADSQQQILYLASNAGMLASGSLLLDQEICALAQILGNNAVRVIRGVAGTEAAAHGHNAQVVEFSAADAAQGTGPQSYLQSRIAGGLPPLADRQIEETKVGPASYQIFAADLDLDSAAGKDAPDSAFLAPIMGNVHGDSLTKTGNLIGGVIGEDSVTGAQAAAVKGGVVGMVADGVSASDGAVVAVLDGDDGGVTTPEAMFNVKKFNSTAGNDPNYGLNLQAAAAGGFSELVPKKAPLRLGKDVCVVLAADVPDATVGATFAGPGALCIDYTHGELYINVGTLATPDWKKMTHAA